MYIILTLDVFLIQWELPVISSPVKQIKGRSSRPSHTTSFIRNFVFNFQHCPSSIEALTHFTGQSCTKPTHLVNSILSRSAQEKWKEKEIGLYWVHSDSAQTSLVLSLIDNFLYISYSTILCIITKLLIRSCYNWY